MRFSFLKWQGSFFKLTMQNNCHIAQRDLKIAILARESGGNVACNWLLNTSCVSAWSSLSLQRQLF
jgi:hypothetical protein